MAALNGHEWRCERFELGVRVCHGLHSRDQGCRWEYYAPRLVDMPLEPVVQRVLEAARAWREHMKTIPGGVFRCDETLVQAIDALDAPRERYTTERQPGEGSWGWAVMNKAACLCLTTSRGDADMIRQALNAHAARKGKA